MIEKQKQIHFGKLYKSVANYGPARFQHEIYADTYLISFTKTEFYKNLYVEVDLEDKIYKEINSITNGKLIALCGPSGSGKSTVTSKVVDKLSKNPRNNVLYIDLRNVEASKEMDDMEGMDIEESFVRELILNEFNNQFPLIVDDQEVDLRNDLFYLITRKKNCCL